MKRTRLFLVIGSSLLASCGGGNKPSQPVQSAATFPSPSSPIMQPTAPTKTAQPVINPPSAPVISPPSSCTTCSNNAPAPSPVPPVVPRPTVQVPPIQLPATIGSTLSADEVKTLLTLHNQARTEVGVNGLSWSSDAAAYIQNWVDQLAATSCHLQHRQPNQYGENLFMGSTGYGVADAVKMWDSEKKNYNGDPISPSNFSNVGHYTQMVWRSTTKVGCAKASCNGMLIIGCNYDPQGNMIGQKPY